MLGNHMIWLCRNGVENKYEVQITAHTTHHTLEKGWFFVVSVRLDVGIFLLQITVGHEYLGWDPLVKIS